MGEEGEKDDEMDVEEVSESTIGSATQSISPTIVNNTFNTAKEETADETSDDEAQGAVIDNIIDRVANKEFPLALPSQQKASKTSDAENIIASITQYEQTTVTSFIEEKWKQYQSSATKVTEKNENVIYAEWVRDYYYVHLQAFLEDRNPKPKSITYGAASLPRPPRRVVAFRVSLVSS